MLSEADAVRDFYSLNSVEFNIFIYICATFTQNPQDMKWFIKCIRNYATFSGRARRAEYWYFVLFQFIFMIVAWCLDWMMFDAVDGLWFYMLTGLFLFLPGLAVSVRRLHDMGRSGKLLLWPCLILFVIILVCLISLLLQLTFVLTAIWACIPILYLVTAIYAIAMLYIFCSAGTPGDNRYGPDPKAEIER